MIPSGFNSPTVLCTTTAFPASAAPGEFCSALLIARTSFDPALVLFVFQIGNLFDDPARLMTWRGALSTMDTDCPAPAASAAETAEFRRPTYRVSETTGRFSEALGSDPDLRGQPQRPSDGR